jgi:transposase InsO family protein
VFSRRCHKYGIEHRMTKPYTPQTNGMVERFNGRVKREVLNILVGSHADLERLLKGYNQAYNARRQRVLKGVSPDEATRRRLKAKPELANPRYIPPDPKAIPAAMRVVISAMELMQPDP